VYNNLDKSLLDDFPDVSIDNSILILLNHETHDANAVFYSINSLSWYNLEKSRFFKQYPDDVKNVVYDVYSTLADYYGKNDKKSLCERFFGKMYSSSYAMFKSAVFFQHKGRNDYVYEISDICKYKYERGSWRCERLIHYGDNNHQIGVLLKNIDYFMRQKFNFKSTLKPENTSEILRAIITVAIDSYQEKKRIAQLPSIEIDVSKLQNIRNAALEIQNKLIVEIEELDEEVKQENVSVLNAVEQEFLKCLLYGKAYDSFLQSNCLMKSVLIDAINERLFDMFGDIVIVDDGNSPVLIEDYVDMLKGIIAE
jgi:hypothetical protein